MKNRIVLMMLGLAVFAGLVSCKGGEETEKAVESEETATVRTEEQTETGTGEETFPQSEEPATVETEAPTEAPTVPTEAAGDGTLKDNGKWPEWATYSNKSVPYGNDWDDKDAKGLPQGVHYYEAVYGTGDPVYYIKTDEKLLYLTMDEGYEAGYTPKILDTLKAKNVKAVFFITKQFFDSDPELVQRMIDEGHVIGNHTCRHPAGGYPKYADEHGFETFTEDVAALHKLVFDRFGYTMRLFRFPEGEFSEKMLAWLRSRGYNSVFRSYAHYDYNRDKQPEVSVTLERCLNHMAPGAVYLLHAVSSSNTEALSDFIDGAREAGYDFGVFPVDEVVNR